MTDLPIISQLPLWPFADWPPKKPENKPNLHTFWRHPERWPAGVADSLTVQRNLELLGPLNWADFPERTLEHRRRYRPIPFASLAALELLKLNEHLVSMGDVHRCLWEHPGFISLFGFPLTPAFHHPLGFNAQASLPTPRHLTHMVRVIPAVGVQFLLTDSVRLIMTELAARQRARPECVSLDTKHILAWVKENNPKTDVPDRFNKLRQPRGDPDCKLGCKRRHNQFTPAHDGQPASTVKVGEYYWGYASGVVVAKVAPYGEFVVAELTQPFDQGDLTYFFPLMHQTERNLGYRPRFGTFDAAFDAWYVYAYFHRDSDPSHGMAVVPFSEKGGVKADGRQFAPDGLPLCAAGLPMPLRFTFTDRTACLVIHERGKYVCPLHFPTRTARACPVRHPQWKKGGCVAMMPTSIGARLRYQLDRESALYQQLSDERSAIERINSQAVALGIERPHLRNGAAIANQNTLIYTLINLRFLQRLWAQPV